MDTTVTLNRDFARGHRSPMEMYSTGKDTEVKLHLVGLGRVSITLLVTEMVGTYTSKRLIHENLATMLVFNLTSYREHLDAV